MIYCWLSHQINIVKPEFMRKLEGYLKDELEKKDYRLEHTVAIALIESFGRQRVVNDKLW